VRAPAAPSRGATRLAVAAAALLGPCGGALADTPMAYTVGFGTRDYGVVSLLWALLITSLVVIFIVTVLLLAGLFRRRAIPPSEDARQVPVERPDRGISWIYVGSAISAAVLVGAALWTFSTLAAVSGPPVKPALTIHVTGHQWWWEARYESNETSRIFTTANEIHIPTGKPVKMLLSSVDVIHSFWVPQLTGKTDLIPGQQNQSWIEADTAGTYRGQCGEYCGLQHAHMALAVVAQPQQQFDAWWEHQLEPPPPPANRTVTEGQANFLVHCALCHAVRGTTADGKLGPDLSHLMTRQTIASGTLPNTIGYLSAWIADPQHIKPGNLMPILELSSAQLSAVRDYLETLK